MYVNKIVLSSQPQSSQLETTASAPPKIKAVVNNTNTDVPPFGHAFVSNSMVSDFMPSLPTVTDTKHNNVMAEDQCETLLLL